MLITGTEKSSSRIIEACLILLFALSVNSLAAPALGQTAVERQPRRVALVIGNSDYKVGKLGNPENDARDITAALEQVGFDVTMKLDRTKFEIEQDIDDVTVKLAAGDAVMFFYAGHGVQLKNSNYLVPIDAKLDREHHVQQRCVNVDYLLSAIEGSGASLRIVVLDACRNNPFRSFSRNSRRGLAAIAAPEGTIVAYSTAPGHVAADGRGENSPFTKHLVNVLQSNPRQGLEVSQLFTLVARAVKRETGQRAFLTTDASMDSFWLKPALDGRLPIEKNPTPSAVKPLDSYEGLDFDLVKKSAEQGEARAQADLGYMYIKGEGVEQNDQQAAQWLQKAAKQGDAKGQGGLGYTYHTGRGVERSYPTAVKWYRKAADQGFANAQANLGYMYQYGKGVEQSFELAIKWYRKAAEQEDARAQHNLGNMYQNGTGVEQNYQQAVQWFQKAAEQGVAEAKHSLGQMYQYGNGAEQSDQQAVAWYLKAAEQGNARAQSDLGAMYERGKGAEQSDQRAVQWYRKAAQQGDVTAQTNLGAMYQKGKGVEQNDQQAVQWFQKAAGQGHVTAQTNLGVMYRDGKSVEQSDYQAAQWFQKAADQGDVTAQTNLGYSYEFGKGVAVNRDEAIRLYRLAAQQNSEYAIKQLRRLGVDK